ncbi:MAG: hypothetical protein IK149_05135 [Oscillospiraceae bacterium]|nr:hypothetical protein [Oscillospiraceae bacterium]
MKSDVIKVSSKDDRTDLVLDQADRMAFTQKLSHKGALHLRLLAEEMMCLMRAITGDVDGQFWIENKGQEYELHLHCNTFMDEYKRRQLLSASTSGKNEATRGFMGKLRAFFEPAEGLPILYDTSSDGSYGDMVWSMRSYQERLHQYIGQNKTDAEEAWDELEKSVVSHLAKDVKVSIRGSEVEMTVYRNLE